MKFKIGDKVRIKKGLKTGEFYDGLSFNSNMKEFEGKETTINHFTPLENYVLEITDKWYFNDAMLEPVEENYKIKTCGSNDFVIDTTDEQIKIKCDFIHKIDDHAVEIDGKIVFKTKGKINNIYKVIA